MGGCHGCSLRLRSARNPGALELIHVRPGQHVDRPCDVIDRVALHQPHEDCLVKPLHRCTGTLRKWATIRITRRRLNIPRTYTHLSRTHRKEMNMLSNSLRYVLCRMDTSNPSYKALRLVHLRLNTHDQVLHITILHPLIQGRHLVLFRKPPYPPLSPANLP